MLNSKIPEIQSKVPNDVVCQLIKIGLLFTKAKSSSLHFINDSSPNNDNESPTLKSSTQLEMKRVASHQFHLGHKNSMEGSPAFAAIRQKVKSKHCGHEKPPQNLFSTSFWRYWQISYT